jgi:predicted ATP-grasp superfamily ATP-dependent carboligase
MLEEFQETAAIEHRGGNGSVREVILQRFLKYVPRSVEVVSNGEIVNSSGEVSPQCDVFI